MVLRVSWLTNRPERFGPMRSPLVVGGRSGINGCHRYH
jgi:hypothetical protein